MRCSLSVRLIAAVLAFMLCAGLAFAADSAASHSRILITAPIDNSARMTIEGNTRPEANAKNDRGILPDSYRMEHMQLLLRRPAEQEKALRQLHR